MGRTTRIMDLVAELRADGCLTNIERHIVGRAREDAETLDAANELLEDDGWRLSGAQLTSLKELITALEGRLARTEKGLLARGARLQRMSFNTPVTK